MFPGLTHLEARRERLRECTRVAGVSGVDPLESMEGKWLRECARLREFRELTRLEVWRERLRECIRVAGISGVDLFGSEAGTTESENLGCGSFRG